VNTGTFGLKADAVFAVNHESLKTIKALASKFSAVYTAFFINCFLHSFFHKSFVK
jgi:hypothetical protein